MVAVGSPMSSMNKPRRPSQATLVAAAMLACGAAAWICSHSARAGAPPPSTAGTIGCVLPSSGRCAWTPFLLSDEQQRWAVDAARLHVPSLVSQMRRLLTAQLALGALGVPGDFVETGVYTGGTSILMLKALEAYDTPEARAAAARAAGAAAAAPPRRLWAADSFQGLPPPVAQDSSVPGLHVGAAGQFTSSLDTFRANLAAHHLHELDARVKVLPGWFNESLPGAPISAISFLRLDGDLYASTMDSLTALYDRLSPGGIVYADDYGSFAGCRAAVDEFRAARGITAPLMVQALPDSGLDRPGKDAAWEAAWWVKC